MAGSDASMTEPPPHGDSRSSTGDIDGMENLELDASQETQVAPDAAALSTKDHPPPSASMASAALQESGLGTSVLPQTAGTKSSGCDNEGSSPIAQEIIVRVLQPTSYATEGQAPSSSPLSPTPTSLEQGQQQGIDIEHVDDVEMASSTPLRRSMRSTAGKLATTRLGDDVAEEQASKTPRRTPKRKAAAVSMKKDIADIPDNMLEDSLRPMTKEELDEWDGWIEIESEPAFFNTILRNLGVQDVLVKEIAVLEDIQEDYTPKPIYGFIFLYQYVDDDFSTGHEEETNRVWFINQTVDSACATLAMLNIVMNASELDVGQRLRNLKDTTQGMSPARRGHAVSEDKFIRATHNAFGRRIDVLTADKVLEEKAEKPPTRPRKVVKKSVPKKGKTTRRKPDSDSANHYIAFIPADGWVWQLDGLCANPVKIRLIENDKPWTDAVVPTLQAYFDRYDSDNFSMLAICESPTRGIRSRLAAVLRKIYLVEDLLHGSPELETLRNETPLPIPRNNAGQLERYCLTNTAVFQTSLPEEDEHGIYENAADNREHLLDMWRALSTEISAIMGDYDGHLADAQTDQETSAARKEDYTPAIHAWMKTLADKGVLEDILG